MTALVARDVQEARRSTACRMGVPEVDSSLTAGRVTAAYASPLAAVALQWYTKVKFMTSMPMSFAHRRDRDLRARRPRRSRRRISSSSRRSRRPDSKKSRKEIRKANDEARTTMTRKGVTVVQTPATTVDEFSKQAATVQKELRRQGLLEGGARRWSSSTATSSGRRRAPSNQAPGIRRQAPAILARAGGAKRAAGCAAECARREVAAGY